MYNFRKMWPLKKLLYFLYYKSQGYQILKVCVRSHGNVKICVKKILDIDVVHDESQVSFFLCSPYCTMAFSKSPLVTLFNHFKDNNLVEFGRLKDNLVSYESSDKG